MDKCEVQPWDVKSSQFEPFLQYDHYDDDDDYGGGGGNGYGDDDNGNVLMTMVMIMIMMQKMILPVLLK